MPCMMSSTSERPFREKGLHAAYRLAAQVGFDKQVVDRVVMDPVANLAECSPVCVEVGRFES